MIMRRTLTVLSLALTLAAGCAGADSASQALGGEQGDAEASQDALGASGGAGGAPARSDAQAAAEAGQPGTGGGGTGGAAGGTGGAAGGAGGGAQDAGTDAQTHDAMTDTGSAADTRTDAQTVPWCTGQYAVNGCGHLGVKGTWIGQYKDGYLCGICTWPKPGETMGVWSDVRSGCLAQGISGTAPILCVQACGECAAQ